MPRKTKTKSGDSMTSAHLPLCRALEAIREERKTKERSLPARLRSRARWAKLRAAHRKQNPLCCNPLGIHSEGVVVPASDSHHIVAIHDNPARAYDINNIAPLCALCHSHIERLERKGVDTSIYFNSTR